MSYEQLANTLPPRPQQIAALAARLVTYGIRNDLVEKIQTEHGIQKRVHPIVIEHEPQSADASAFTIEDRIALTIQSYAGHDWSMRLIRGMHAVGTDSGRIGQAEVYAFNWNKDQVLRSQRRMLADEALSRTPIDEHLRLSDSALQMLSAENELRAVQRGDLEYLRSDVEAVLAAHSVHQ